MTDPGYFAELVAAYIDGRAGGQTPVNSLPYPSPGDPVQQGAAAMQALATALDGLVFPMDYRAITGSASQSIGNNVWAKLGTFLTTPEAGSVGSGITSSANGLNFVRPGVYLMTAMCLWSGTVGRRIMGFGPATDAAPGSLVRSSNHPDGAGVYQTYSELVNVTVTGLWSLWVQQLTGANQTITDRRWAARRIA